MSISMQSMFQPANSPAPPSLQAHVHIQDISRDGRRIRTQTDIIDFSKGNAAGTSIPQPDETTQSIYHDYLNLTQSFERNFADEIVASDAIPPENIVDVPGPRYYSAASVNRISCKHAL